MKTKIITRLLAPVVAALALGSTAQAASVSYYLNQSNALPDGVNYLQVTIADGVDGAIDFTVTALEPLLAVAGSNFGIQNFAFNVPNGSRTGASKVTNLAQGWRARNDFRMSTFGMFDIKVTGNGNSRLDTVTFSITGVDGDTPMDYVNLSSKKASGGNQFFAAHVTGFKYGELCNAPASQRIRARLQGQVPCVSSAYFAGSLTADPVPLPATAWLFLTGIAGVAVRARRRILGR